MDKNNLYMLVRACYLREKLDSFITEVFNKDSKEVSIDLLEIISNWLDNFDICPFPDQSIDERESEGSNKENVGEEIFTSVVKEPARNKLNKIGERPVGSVFF